MVGMIAAHCVLYYTPGWTILLRPANFAGVFTKAPSGGTLKSTQTLKEEDSMIVSEPPGRNGITP